MHRIKPSLKTLAMKIFGNRKIQKTLQHKFIWGQHFKNLARNSFGFAINEFSPLKKQQKEIDKFSFYFLSFLFFTIIIMMGKLVDMEMLFFVFRRFSSAFLVFGEKKTVFLCGKRWWHFRWYFVNEWFAYFLLAKRYFVSCQQNIYGERSDSFYRKHFILCN